MEPDEVLEVGGSRWRPGHGGTRRCCRWLTVKRRLRPRRRRTEASICASDSLAHQRPPRDRQSAPAWARQGRAERESPPRCLARHRVDFRKRFDGLLAEAFQRRADLYDGDCVLFVKRDHTQLRAVVGDGVGLYLICRRFEGGRLRNLAAFAPQPGAAEISTGELSLLL